MGIIQKLGEYVKDAIKKPKNTPDAHAENQNTLPRSGEPVQSRRLLIGKKVESLYRKPAETPRHIELLKDIETQYPKMKSTLERYEISTKGMPTWEQVKNGLTPEVLDKALKLAEPTLLLVPPTSRQSKVEAINKHPTKKQKSDTYAFELNDNNLWNGGKSKTENKWRVSIVEGVQDVAQDDEIYDDKRTNDEMSELWVKKYEDQGLDTMNDADTYLMLMMKGLAEDKPLDPRTNTVLNGKNLTKSSVVALGYWHGGQVYLSYANPDDVRNFLRLRGLVGVDVPEAA